MILNTSTRGGFGPIRAAEITGFLPCVLTVNIFPQPFTKNLDLPSPQPEVTPLLIATRVPFVK